MNVDVKYTQNIWIRKKKRNIPKTHRKYYDIITFRNDYCTTEILQKCGLLNFNHMIIIMTTDGRGGRPMKPYQTDIVILLGILF